MHFIRLDLSRALFILLRWKGSFPRIWGSKANKRRCTNKSCRYEWKVRRFDPACDDSVFITALAALVSREFRAHG